MRFELLNNSIDSLNYNSTEELIDSINKLTESKYKIYDDFVVDYLKDAWINKYFRQLEDAIYFVSSENKNRGETLNILHQVLLEGWHPWHEIIVSTLEDFRDISSIDYLFKAFSLKSDWFDNRVGYYMFHKNLMWAIYKIGGEECKDRLRSYRDVITSEIDDDEFEYFLEKDMVGNFYERLLENERLSIKTDADTDTDTGTGEI